jgi:hypothetical protein
MVSDKRSRPHLAPLPSYGFRMERKTSAPPPMLPLTDDHSSVVKDIAERDGMLAPFIPEIIDGLRNPKNSISRQNYAEAARLAIKNGKSTARLLPPLVQAMGDGDLMVQYSGLLAMAYHAERNGDLSERYVEAIRSGLGDIPRNREAALRALKSYASQGEGQTSFILERFGKAIISIEGIPPEGLTARQAAIHDLACHCRTLIERWRVQSIEAKIASVVARDAGGVSAYRWLESFAKSSATNARDVISAMGSEELDMPLLSALRKVCQESSEESG